MTDSRWSETSKNYFYDRGIDDTFIAKLVMLPTPFDGTSAKARTFLAECVNYIDLNNPKFASRSSGRCSSVRTRPPTRSRFSWNLHSPSDALTTWCTGSRS